MARFFTGTDKAAWGATSVPLTSSWSASFWWRRSGTPAANMRIFDFSTSFVSSDAGATPAIRLQRDYATTDGAWNVTYANLGSPTLTTWNHFCWTHVDGATPKLYFNGVAKTVTTATAPVGAVDTTTARTLTIGNRSAGDRATEGDIAWVGIYHRELTAGEVALTMHNGVAPTPAWVYPLLGDSPEPNYGGSSKSVTLTGSTVVNGPPTTPAFFDPALAYLYRAFAPAAPTSATPRRRRSLTGVGR